MKARAVGQAGAYHLSANNNKYKQAKVAAKPRFGKPQKGNLNW